MSDNFVFEDEIEKRVRLAAIKARLDSTESISEVSDTVAELTEADAKILLKMYVFDK